MEASCYVVMKTVMRGTQGSQTYAAVSFVRLEVPPIAGVAHSFFPFFLFPLLQPCCPPPTPGPQRKLNKVQ